MFQVMVIWTGTWMIWDSDVLFVDCQLEDKVSWVYVGYLFKRVVKKARHRGMAHMFHGHFLFHIVSYCFILFHRFSQWKNGISSGIHPSSGADFRRSSPVPRFGGMDGRRTANEKHFSGSWLWEGNGGTGMGMGHKFARGTTWMAVLTCFDYEPFPFLLETQFCPIPMTPVQEIGHDN